MLTSRPDVEHMEEEGDTDPALDLTMAFTPFQRSQVRKDRVLDCWTLQATEGRGSIDVRGLGRTLLVGGLVS